MILNDHCNREVGCHKVECDLCTRSIIIKHIKRRQNSIICKTKTKLRDDNDTVQKALLIVFNKVWQKVYLNNDLKRYYKKTI